MSRRGRGRGAGGGGPMGWGGTSSSPLVGSNPWLVHPGAALVEAPAGGGSSATGGSASKGASRPRGGGASGSGSLSHHEKNGGDAVPLECTLCAYLGPLHCPEPAARRELTASLLACAATFGAVASHKEVGMQLSHRAPFFCDARGGAWQQCACTRLDITFSFEQPAIAACAGLRSKLTAEGAPYPPAVAAAFAGAAAPRITRPRLPGAASYAAPLLRPRELCEAYFAAGLVPWRLHPATAALEVLLGEEQRKGSRGAELSLLMGKREDAMDVDAAACAAREADEEAAFVFGEAWQRRVAAVLRGEGSGGEEGGQPAAPAGAGAGGGGEGGGSSSSSSSSSDTADTAAVAALELGLGALRLAPTPTSSSSSSSSSSGGSSSSSATTSATAARAAVPSHAVWVQDAKGAVFLLPVEELVQGTALTADGLPQAHAQKRASMSPAALAAGECSMHRLEWCPTSTVLSDARVGAFAKSALRPVLAALLAVLKKHGVRHA